MSRPEPPAVVRARVVAYLCRVLPVLAVEEAEQALAAVNAHRHIGLRRLDSHLRQHPDALSSGDADMPPSLHRLLRHLHAAGYQVTVPACAQCGKQRRLPERSPQGRVCSSCAAAGRMRLCVRCGVVRVVAAVLPEGRCAAVASLRTRRDTKSAASANAGRASTAVCLTVGRCALPAHDALLNPAVPADERARWHDGLRPAPCVTVAIAFTVCRGSADCAAGQPSSTSGHATVLLNYAGPVLRGPWLCASTAEGYDPVLAFGRECRAAVPAGHTLSFPARGAGSTSGAGLDGR